MQISIMLSKENITLYSWSLTCIIYKKTYERGSFMGNGYIGSFLDNDQYKFNMQFGVCKLFPRAVVDYTFINRDDRRFPDDFGSELRRIVDTFRELTLTKEGRDFLREKCYYFDPVYLDFLSGYRYNPDEVIIRQEGSKLFCEIHGPWYRTILWEVPLMAVISQLYFEKTGETTLNRVERQMINKKKFQALNELGISYADFCTRRRYSLQNHTEVVWDLKEFGKNHLTGSSNTHMAMTNGLTPIGTQAHEWFQYHAAKYGFRMANEMAMRNWINVYEGNLGIALPDTYTTEVFFKSFNTLFAKQYDGMRHDSGSPLDFITKSVNHYKSLNIDPLSKSLIFSDNLNSIEKVRVIHETCTGIIKDSYGIGTWFGNDVNVHPLNMVIKMTGAIIDGHRVPTVKLSDDRGKNTGESEMVDLCRRTLAIAA